MSQTPAPIMNQLMQGEDPSGYFHDPGDLAGGMPINLDSLRDGPPGSKPFYPYSTLIRYAIKGSPHQKLLLEDIYYAIESRFPYFRTAANGWKNSVRHNLSLSPCFEKIPRPLTDRGKGSYWIVNDNVDPRTGVHRVRKKKKSGKGKAAKGEEMEDEDYAEGNEGNNEQNFEGEFPGGPNQPAQQATEAEADPSPVSPQSQVVQPQQPQQQHPPQQHQQQLPPPGFPPNIFPPPPPFDPQQQGFMHPGMQYAHPPPHPMGGIHMGDQVELTENGEINWRVAWHKELGHLQSITKLQDEANADPGWYHMMLYRLRHALLTPMDINGHMLPPPGGIVMPPPPQQQQPPAGN